MGLFDSVGKFFDRATGGLFGPGIQPDYNSMFARQSALYQEELKRRQKQFESNEVLNANTASTRLLTGGSRPVGSSGAAGADFSVLMAEDKAKEDQRKAEETARLAQMLKDFDFSNIETGV